MWTLALIGRSLVGLLILLVFTWVGGFVRKILYLPLPGPVIGLVLLAIVLILMERRFPRGVRPIQLNLTPVARLLLSHMGLLFVPAGVGIMTESELLLREWLPIVVGLLGSTILGLAATGWFMYRCIRTSDEGGV